MLSDHISGKLVQQLGNKLTASQRDIAGAIGNFLTDDSDDALLLMNGYAGTGKTTVIAALVRLLGELKIRVFLLAPTGRAAKVLSSYTGRPAYTIHKKIYRQQSSKDGMGRFTLDRNLHARTVFIVDEGSMLASESQPGSPFGFGNLLDDLLEYVYNGKGCKLIISGDTAQLPPVGFADSPALSSEVMKRYSDTIYAGMLKDVVRQEQTSGILQNATEVRRRIESGDVSLPMLREGDTDDFVRVSGADLIETLSDSYDKTGMEETIVISRSNKRANKFNEGIRNSILWREEELVPGDLLMVVRNNYFWLQDEAEFDFIANGDIIEVVRIHRHQELYGHRFADCTLRLLDYNAEIEAKVMLDTLREEGPSLGAEKNKEFFYAVLEDYSDLKPRKKQYEAVRNDPFFNAVQVKFAYAITCHKSQGGQWKTVFIDQGYLTEERIDMEYLRWLYTAITRATEKVYLVNFPEFLWKK